MKSVLIIFALVFSYNLIAQQAINTGITKQEIVLVGTMHQVPNLVKNAYAPMYRKAKRYQPDAIFVEYVPSHDTASIAFDTPWFIELSDSISATFNHDLLLAKAILAKNIKDMTKEDYLYMKDYYAVNLDYANYKYYKHLAKFGTEKPKNPTRNEMGDVSIRLAIEMNHKEIASMDYQSSNAYYYKYWRACDSISVQDGEAIKINKTQKRLYLKSVAGTLLYGLSRHTNKNSTMVSYHTMNAFEYREVENEACTLGGYWWDFRNAKMAENVGTQVLEQGHGKSIVVVGAGHVVGMKKELEKQFPQLIIKTLYK